ncbi:MAG: amidohydrolase [Proteobacteria bacterium]|nr:amidohydrolase [Pseudomonadota bacterium]
MLGKVALEEHFAIPETLGDSSGYLPGKTWDELRARILDIQERRLAEMDRHGIEFMILSLNAPAIQAIAHAPTAIALARLANDVLAAEIAKRPDRFAGFAALPLQDPQAAADELTRCVRDFGFKGALVNGFSNGAKDGEALYYDLAQYRAFWEVVERLDVPFYLHPRNPLPQDTRVYEGHRWLMGPTWAFGHETAVHALRLMGSGLFDAHPRLKIILGHLGEGLPYSIWRVDNCNGWVESRHAYPAKKRICDYFLANFHLTTSGNFSTQTLIAAMMVVGADRIMFSADWPFENVEHAARWFDHADIGENNRVRIGRANAMRLFKLGT